MARPKKEASKLTELGKKGESVLKRVLQDIDTELLSAKREGRESKYSLTDLMKIEDRVLKFEFINMKLKENDDDEGFFSQRPEGADDE